jgi:hypothetical protein
VQVIAHECDHGWGGAIPGLPPSRQYCLCSGDGQPGAAAACVTPLTYPGPSLRGSECGRAGAGAVSGAGSGGAHPTGTRTPLTRLYPASPPPLSVCRTAVGRPLHVDWVNQLPVSPHVLGPVDPMPVMAEGGAAALPDVRMTIHSACRRSGRGEAARLRGCVIGGACMAPFTSRACLPHPSPGRLTPRSAWRARGQHVGRAARQLVGQRRHRGPALCVNAVFLPQQPAGHTAAVPRPRCVRCEGHEVREAGRDPDTRCAAGVNTSRCYNRAHASRPLPARPRAPLPLQPRVSRA